MYYAHTKVGLPEDEWQKLSDHLTGTSELAGKKASKFNGEEYGKVAGLLHDAGKYSIEFQKRLRGSKVPVDHSTAGAKEAFEKYGLPGLILAYVVAGHHTGMPDWIDPGSSSSLSERIENADLPDYKEFHKEISLTDKLPPLPIKIHGRDREEIRKSTGFSLSFFTRMLYSCLVDADYRDTERFIDPQKSKNRDLKINLSQLLQNLDTYMEAKCSKSSEGYINRKRNEIRIACIEKSSLPKGMFSLKVPTGGGKTLSSLEFAIRHAICHNMDRVIYAIPYTSIIEQNAQVFREALGEEFVLEHHSNFLFDRDEDDSNYEDNPLRLAAEDWNIPVVVTTNVQFFESLFSNRSSRCRKLHNLCNSVIVLDEAQMIPIEFLKPCLAAICELIRNYGCSVVLCTATQPDINDFLPVDMKPREIIHNADELFRSLKRVKTSYVGRMTDEELSTKLKDCRQVLCIVNTKSRASQIYDLINDGEGIYHLSTFMCPIHRNKKLNEIKECLKASKQNSNLPCRVVSTQLVEAGVDLDFPTVYREIAGIDSINQAAGRCNREGRLEWGRVFVFEPEKPLASDSFLARAASIGRSVLRKYDDPMLLEAIKEYFRCLYHQDENLLDKHRIIEALSECGMSLQFPFATIARLFRLISNNQVSLIIPYDERCRKMLSDAQWLDKPEKLARKLQPYVVPLEVYQFKDLEKNNLIETVAGVFYVLSDMKFYDDNKGLILPKGTVEQDILIY